MTDLQVGDRIELVSMGDDPDPIEPGTKGTVNWIGAPFQGHDQIGVKWDDGRTLGLTVPPDRYRKLSEGTMTEFEASLKQVFAESPSFLDYWADQGSGGAEDSPDAWDHYLADFDENPQTLEDA